VKGYEDTHELVWAPHRDKPRVCSKLTGRTLKANKGRVLIYDKYGASQWFQVSDLRPGGRLQRTTRPVTSKETRSMAQSVVWWGATTAAIMAVIAICASYAAQDTPDLGRAEDSWWSVEWSVESLVDAAATGADFLRTELGKWVARSGAE
jgi:hypothetical protein